MAGVAWRPLPEWLRALQGAFGDTLRHPLDRSQGRLRATTERYDAALVCATKPSRSLAADERLAVYNRQYWRRLFTVLHRAYPLVARLLGYWELNRLASDYLRLHPPRSWDLDEIVPGFEPFLAAQAESDAVLVAEPPRRLPALAVREAALIDAAHHRVFRAPTEPPYRPAASDGATLLQTQLRFVSTAALVTESWALCELRRHALSLAGEERVELGDALPAPRDWLLMRQELSVGLFLLDPREGELLRLLQQHPVADALGRLEARCSPEGRAGLPAQTQAWLARSVKLGLWARVVGASS